MTRAQIEEAFAGAEKIEFTGDNKAFVHFNDCAQMLVFIVKDEEAPTQNQA